MALGALAFSDVRTKKALPVSGVVLGLLFQAAAIAAVVLYVRVSISLKGKLADSGPCRTTTLYSRPATMATGDEFTTGEIATELRAAGSAYQLSQDKITINPASTRIRVSGGKIVEIMGLWVGYDDNTDLKLEGAKSALPIWAEFMKRAAKRAEYRQPLGKIAPGITMARIDAGTGLLAGPNCPKVRMEYFLRATEPREICDQEARESGGASRVGTPAASPRETSASSSPPF